MIYFIINLLRTSVLLFLINNGLKYTYPEKYNTCLITITFNAIYIFSMAQIKFRKCQEYMYKTYPRLKSFIDEYSKTVSKNRHNIEVILDGNVICKTFKENILNNFPESYSLVIYSDYSNTSETNYVNKKIIHSELSKYNNFDYEVSNIKFMFCEIHIGDKTYKINLKSENERYNYYLVDNIIDKKFIIYYLIEFYNEDFHKSEDKFILILLDHNINSFEIDITDASNYIQIKKDDYVTN